MLCKALRYALSLDVSQAPVTIEHVVTVTSAAQEHLLTLPEFAPDTDFALKIDIVSGPGEPFSYDLTTEQIGTGTQGKVIVQGLVKVLLDESSLHLLEGSVLDHTSKQGLVIRNPNKPAPKVHPGLVTDSLLAAQVREVVQSAINPALLSHEGSVSFIGHDENNVAYLSMEGGCHGCSMSAHTMRDGIARILSARVPEITAVRDITDHETGQNPYYS